MHAVSAILAVVLLAGCAFLLTRAVHGARGSSAGPRGMRSRSASPRSAASGRGRTALRSAGTAGRSLGSVAVHPANRAIRAQAKADTHRAWQEAFATDWLEQQRHERQNGHGGDGGTTTTARPTLRQRLRLAPFDPAAPGPPGNGNGNGNGNGRQPADSTSPPAAPGNGGPPARQVPASPAPASPPSPDGGNPVPGTPSGAPAEQMIEAIQAIYAHAASGGINAKQEAVRAAHEGAVRFASMMQMLARTMSEPGSHYGPEITEPLSKAGQHFQAGAMSLSEADNNLETLANMTLREASASPRQVPHHEHELSESGRH